MELLIVAFAELVVQIMVLAITLTINLIALALEILFLILEGGISGYLAARKKKQEAAQNVEEIQELPERPKRSKSLWHKIAVRGTIVCSAILLFLVLTAVIANAFFFESVMRFALRQVDHRTDIAIEFDKAEGSFWTGRVRLFVNGINGRERTIHIVIIMKTGSDFSETGFASLQNGTHFFVDVNDHVGLR